jgi:hypothetical protein
MAANRSFSAFSSLSEMAVFQFTDPRQRHYFLMIIYRNYINVNFYLKIHILYIKNRINLYC